MKLLLKCILLSLCIYSVIASAQTQKIVFASSNPVDFPQLLAKKSLAPQMIWGLLDLPPVTNKVPLVIMMSGSSGILPSTVKYVTALNKMGIATLRVNSLTPRGVKETVTDQSAISLPMLVADAYAAFNFMAKYPAIDPQKIAIMGWSKGGLISLMTAFEDLNTRLIQIKSQRFAAHIAFYPACNVLFPDTHLDGKPWLYVHGGMDDYTSPDICLNLISKLRNSTTITTVLFPNAYHAFDNDKPVTWDTFAQNPANCQGKFLANWAFADAHTGMLIQSQWDFKKAFWRCMHLGAHTGNNAAASQGAMRALTLFLQQYLNLGYQTNAHTIKQ